MASSSYSIHPIDTIDVPVLVELLYSLKSTLAFNRAVFKNWPNEAAQKALYRATIENTFAPTSETESLKAVDDETGDIIGYVAVSRESPIAQTPTPNEQEKQSQHSNAEGPGVEVAVEQEQGQTEEDLSAFNPGVYDAVVKACLELQRGVETCDHFGMDTIFFPWGRTSRERLETNQTDQAEITYVGVKPSCRNRGIGAKLIHECFNRAKKAGFPLTLNAEPEAVKFYLKLGFKETGYADIDLARWMAPNSGFGNFRWTAMIWYP
jgi:ribosomal protein S18 acetylase RimI-like enzyme